MKITTPPLFRNIKDDLPASVALFIVAIPLCLGIAHASGAPMIAGLIAGIVGGIVVGMLSESNLSVSGPAAGLTAICMSAIQDLGSYQGLVTAIFIAGALQMLLGFFKLGFFANYIPGTVIKGMLAAIGLILIMKQLPHLIGYDVEEMGIEEFDLTNEDLNTDYHEKVVEHENTFSLLFHSLRHINIYVMGIGISSLLLLIGWDTFLAKKIKFIPASLAAVCFGTGLSLLINAFFTESPMEADHFVALPTLGFNSDFSKQFVLPTYSYLSSPQLYKVIFTLAIVASLESLLSIEALQKLDENKHQVDVNRELIAQGAGNMVSASFGGLPITSVIVRGSVNIAAGAKSKLSAILHGIFILLALLFFVKFINQIPLACLAAILCFTGYKLIKPSMFKEIYAKGISQFLPFIVTIAAITMSDLLIGVVVGMATASFFIIKENYRAPVLKVHNLGLRKRIILGDNVSFLHKNLVITTLQAIEPDSILEIDGSKTQFIDPDIIEVIRDFKVGCKQRNIELIIGGIKQMENKEEMSQEIEKSYQKLFENNKKWVEGKIHADPNYFKNLTKGQKPEYLFIGCSDSRVPANEITGTDPGEMFVHRNIANLVVNTDVNLLSVLQYSVEVLNVKHVIICGHYGCGGVKAAMEENQLGLIDEWLRNIKDIYNLHLDEFKDLSDPVEKNRKMVEVNVREQVFNLMKTSIVQKNRELYGIPQVHGWVYDIADGYIRDLKLDAEKDFPNYSIYKYK